MEKALADHEVVEVLSDEIRKLPWISNISIECSLGELETCIHLEAKGAGHICSIKVGDYFKNSGVRVDLVSIESDSAGINLFNVFRTEEEVRKCMHDVIIPKFIRVYYKRITNKLCHLFDTESEKKADDVLVWSIADMKSNGGDVGKTLTFNEGSIGIWYKEPENGEMPKLVIHHWDGYSAINAEELPDKIKWIEDLLKAHIVRHCK